MPLVAAIVADELAGLSSGIMIFPSYYLDPSGFLVRENAFQFRTNYQPFLEMYSKTGDTIRRKAIYLSRDKSKM